MVFVLVAWAHAPLSGSGVIGSDSRVLAGAARVAWPELRAEGEDLRAALAGVHGARGRPLAALALGATSWMWSERGRWSDEVLLALRLENLVLLLFAAFFLGRFVEHLLLPWTASDQAGAAGLAATLVLSVHPLSLAAVASAAARADLLGAVLATGAGFAFLRGRQERRYGLVFLAAALTAACAAATELAWLVPPALALCEHVSARRYRARAVRRRTALTTLVAFGGCVALEAALLSRVGAAWRPHELARTLSALASPEPALRALAQGFERLGVLVLPVNAAGLGAPGFVLAALLLLLVLQPALRAARSAPRFWAAVLVAWTVAAVATALYRADVRVQPGDMSGAAGLFPAALVMAMGLAVAATALTGRRRIVLPALTGLGLCVLAHADALCFAQSARAAGALADDLRAARAAHADAAHVLALDPPGLVAGRLALERDLAPLLDPAWTGAAARATPVRARGLSAVAFLALAREPEMSALRAEGLVLLLPARLLDGERGAGRVAVRVPAAGAEKGAGQWREEGRSPPLDLDPFDTLALRVVARPGATAGAPPVAAWEARSALVPGGALAGAWLRGADGPVALFDLGRSLPWLLGERARRVWLEGELTAIVLARALPREPPLAGVTEPAVDGDDWLFEPAWAELARPRAGEPDFVLALLDPELYDYEELACQQVGERLVARAAAGFAAGRARVAWSLEQRVGGVVVARAGGRLRP